MTADDEPITRRLRHVYWLGGGSGGGKSTIARRLAAEHGLRLYATDDVMGDHANRLGPDDAPLLEAFKAMDMDERWANRSVEVMLETFHWYRGEGFGLIVEDLLRLPPNQGLIVEGFRLLPHLVAPLLERRNQAAWLIPTPAFRLAAFESRGSMWSIAGRTSQPERALANLLERDGLFTERSAREAKAAGLSVIEVDGSSSEDALVSRIAAQFEL
jgi:2-phosphoglycerate kinase